MCGILGFYGEKTDKLDINKSISILAHRGPDARGVFQENNLILAHLRLSILDLSDTANQPMHSRCNRFVMVYNGEIYNYKEIQAEIQQLNPAYTPSTHSDSEIILQAFAIWNVEFVHKLNGMFAIAIWDKQEKTLYFFRDRIGIKPLYYYQKGNDFGFSSELKVLSSAYKNELNIDYSAVNQYLHLGYIPAPHSIYNEIRKFPAGHYAIFRKGKISMHSYWRPEDKIISAISQKDPQQALEQLKELIIASVQYRLVSDVPYGTFLSGGIDSSLVTAVAQHLHTNPINTFSIGFWEKGYDESGYARDVANYLGTHHHEFMVTERDALQWMPLLTDIYDEPYADSSAIPTLLVSKMARQHVTMTLSGDGGDELFMGYGAYKWAQRLSNPLLRLAASPAAALLPYGPHRYRRAAGLFEPIKSQYLRSHIFSQEQYLFSRKEISKIIKKEYFRSFELEERPAQNLRGLSAAQQQALFDLKYYLPDDLLVKVDRASMHFALETRVPLLDYRIVEWALNLHPSLKTRNGQTKWLLKELLYQYVPEKFFQRPKRGFAIPLQKWLQNELRDFAMDYLSPAALERTALLDQKAVGLLLNRFYNQKQTYLYNRVWQLVVLQKWFMEHDS